MRPRLFAPAFACAAFLVVSAATNAATLTVQDSIDDFEAQHRSDSGVYAASENFANGSRVGFQSSFNGSGAFAPGGITSLYFFQLPVVAPGETVSAARFTVGRLADTATSAVTPTFNADLYALGVVNSISKTAADAQQFFYLGNAPQTALPAGGQTVGGTVSRVVDNFLTPGDFIATGGAASATPNTGDITSYIRDLYANPAANGFTPGTSYLVLRLNPDADTIPTSGTQRYTTAFQGTASNGGAGTPENRPMITIETTPVPEPSAAGLLLVCALGLLCRRRSA